MENPAPSRKVSQAGKTGQLRRPPNSELRDREYLKPDEMETLLKAAKSRGRYPHRDYTLLLLMYRHGLRVSEAIALRWSVVDFSTAHLLVKRLKGGLSSTQPIGAAELRALRKLQRDHPDSPFLFNSERDAPLTDHAVRMLCRRAGKEAGFPFVIHPHMLRHSCGYYLINKGVDVRAIQTYLGHRDIQSTARYTELAPGRFEGFWKD